MLAVALLFRREVLVRLAAAGLLVGTLVAFALSRSDVEVFGFTETGLNPSPQAAIALAAEIIGLIALALTFVPRIGPGRELRPAIAIPVGLAAVALAVAGGALWAESDGAAPTEAASGAATVMIADFEFVAGTLEVPAGTTVVWTNGDAFPHSIVAEDGSFQSPDIGSGADVLVHLHRARHLQLLVRHPPDDARHDRGDLKLASATEGAQPVGDVDEVGIVTGDQLEPPRRIERVARPVVEVGQHVPLPQVVVAHPGGYFARRGPSCAGRHGGRPGRPGRRRRRCVPRRAPPAPAMRP